MKSILLCSSDALLVRNLYGVLRDLGFSVETVEHPSQAVRAVLWKRYDFAIVGAEPFGLSSDDATRILRDLAPDMPIITVGSGQNDSSARTIDLEDFTRALHAFAH